MDKINNRITELDALRGIAALNVVLFHYTSVYRKEFGFNFSQNYDWNFGHYGVQLFFTISGFVIFMSLHHVNSTSEFLFKRFVRLFPTYWICLISTVIFCFVFDFQKTNLQLSTIIINFSMFQGLFHIENIDGSYWSLLPELLFYIMMAVIYYLKLLSKINLIAVVWISLILLSIFKPSFLDILLNLRFGMYFLAGIMFYRIRFEKSSSIEHIIIVACLLSVFIVRRDLECLFVSSIIFLLFYLFIYGKLTFLNKKIFLFLGYISYPLYLLHQTIGYILIKEFKRLGMNELVVVLLTFSIVVIMAWFVVEYIEKPITIRIKKFKLTFA